MVVGSIPTRSTNPLLATKICEHLQIPLGRGRTELFPDGELHVKVEEEDVSRSLIIDGILLIRDEKSPSLGREMLIAYLPANHREDLAAEAA